MVRACCPKYIDVSIQIYSRYDHKNNFYLSRSGDAIKNEGPLGPAMTQKQQEDRVNELAKWDPPPKEKLKSLFDYILSLNQQFYILFWAIEEDSIIHDHGLFIKSILAGKPIHDCTSNWEREHLINLFSVKPPFFVDEDRVLCIRK